jgi:hypothetical protein
MAYSQILDLFFIGNDMSRVHGSVDPVWSTGSIMDQRKWRTVWLVRARCAGGSKTWELDMAGQRERDNGGAVLTGGEGR